MASSDKVLYEKDSVFIHTHVLESKDKDAYIPGRIFFVEKEKPPGLFIEWKVEEVSSLDDHDWAVVGNAVAYKAERDTDSVTINSRIETRKKYNISFDLVDLKSIKTSAIHHGWSYLIFILKDGTTYPALHFHSGGTKEFFTLLNNHVHIKRSTNDNRLYIVEEHDPDMLSKSFDELHLFSDSSEHLVSIQDAFSGNPSVRHKQKFLNDPFTSTLGGFSKVTNFFKDVLLQPETMSTRPKEEMAEVLNEDIAGMEINHQDEPGFELITKTKLPPRPTVNRGEPLQAHQWAGMMDKDGRVIKIEEVKDVIFHGGVEPSIRVEVWKFLLNYYKWDSTHKSRAEERKKKVDDYFKMKLQWKTISEEQEKRFTLLRDSKALIEKDVSRTDRTHKFFEGDGNHNLQVLNDILRTYCMYNFDLSYVQGMSDLLSPILVIMENEVDAFWCFAGFMDKVSSNFEMDQQGMKTQLAQMHTLMHFVDPELCSYLESHDSGNFYFCFRWLLIVFKREFSFPDIQRLWEVLWTEKPCRNYHLLICLAILDSERATLMENRFGFTEILKHINDMCFTINVDQMLNKAESIYLQLKKTKKLPLPIKEMLEMDASSPSSSNSSSSCTTPSGLTAPALPSNLKENCAHASGSGMGRMSPDDSSIEILPENCEPSTSGLHNYYL